MKYFEKILSPIKIFLHFLKVQIRKNLEKRPKNKTQANQKYYLKEK